MQAYGFLPEFPIIRDEHDVIISGHRRHEVAVKLGIESQIRWVKKTYGDDDRGALLRLIDAVAANTQKPLTPADRRYIIARMFPDGNVHMTQAELAELLHTTQTQVSRDLAALETEGVMQLHNSHPERGGRPSKRQPGQKPRQRKERLHSGEQKWGTLERRQEAQQFAYQRHIAEDQPTQVQIAAEVNETFQPTFPIDGTQAWTLVRNQQLTIEDEMRAGGPIPNEWLTPGEELCPHCGGTGRVVVSE